MDKVATISAILSWILAIIRAIAQNTREINGTMQDFNQAMQTSEGQQLIQQTLGEFWTSFQQLLSSFNAE